MDASARLLNYFFVIILVSVHAAVPPDMCFANFRWDDCGKPPVPVMYYWKPGSRCEVGMWRGCLPNINMFPDEYSCISTCIFAQRAGANDYDALEDPKMTDAAITETVTDQNSTDIDGDKNETTTVGNGDHSGADAGHGDATTTADGAGGDTTVAPAK